MEENKKMQADEKNNELMEKIDRKQLQSLDLLYLKEAEQINFQRAVKLKTVRKKNRILATTLAFGALGIYLYTMYAVRQETFLNDLSEPETIIEPTLKKKTI